MMMRALTHFEGILLQSSGAKFWRIPESVDAKDCVDLNWKELAEREGFEPSIGV